MMAFFSHSDNMPISDEERKILETVDRKRIDISDEIFVVNDFYEGSPYYGESTKKELDYAVSLGKKIHFLHERKGDEYEMCDLSKI